MTSNFKSQALIVSTLFFSLILFLFQQLRNEYDGISPDPGGTNRGFPGTSGPPRSEESCGNLQHISGDLEKTNYYTSFNLEIIQILSYKKCILIYNFFLISEREPDDWEQDPSLHPTRETLFMEKTKKSIQSKF